ncbi:MAG TPA: fasciclin domain-containing protein [Bacteroidales bacterium]|nr:fasciclin domain-containing protein [Bacteroidales bacterium]
MKIKDLTMKIIRIQPSSYFLLLLVCLGLLSSCNSDNLKDKYYYTFTGETVASFCKKDQNLSIFYRIINESNNYNMLSLYGHFTCFAPTDSAFQAYFVKKGMTYDQLTEADKQEIINNHIIRNESKEYLSNDFEEGALPTPNMSDRFLVISYSNAIPGHQVILVNKNAPILLKDNEVHNGVVHIVGQVVEPSEDNLLTVLKGQEYFKLFTEAFERTHLIDSVQGIYDLSYKDPSPGADRTNVVGYSIAVVHKRKFGYTLLAETDDVFKAQNINNIDELIEYCKAYYGTEDLDDFTSRRNPLNQFVSYHLLNRQMSTNSFIYSGPNTSAYAMDQRYEYYETMLSKRLIEFKAGNKINLLKDGSYVGVNESQSNLDGMNGYVHALTKILVYNEDNMVKDVLNKRIRIDAYAIPPQLTNNNIRWNLDDSRTIPPNYCGEYFKFNPACKIILWGNNAWDDHQADEISIRGWYDFTLRLPPVPPGTYEIRFGYNAVPWRGIAQLFIDGQIVGIPVDLSKRGSDPTVGWIPDTETNDNGLENDKMMRNRGYMKSGNAIYNSGYNITLRQSTNDLRVIVGTFTFQDYDYHYFRAKNVEREDGEFQLDYIEYVPVSYLDKENTD